MSEIDTKESLAGIHSELKRLNDNIEKVVEKINSAAEEERNSPNYDEWKIESDKKGKKYEIWFIVAIAIGFGCLMVYDYFVK